MSFAKSMLWEFYGYGCGRNTTSNHIVESLRLSDMKVLERGFLCLGQGLTSKKAEKLGIES